MKLDAIIASSKAWISENRAALSAGLVTIAATVGLAFAQGCDLRKAVSVDVPVRVREAIAVDPDDLKGEMTLADSARAWSEWERYVRINTEQFKTAIEDAEGRYATLLSLVDLGIGSASGIASTIPGGAFLVSGLSLFTGILLKRPKEDERVRTEKESSYNAGIEEGKRLAIELSNLVKGSKKA